MPGGLNKRNSYPPPLTPWMNSRILGAMSNASPSILCPLGSCVLFFVFVFVFSLLPPSFVLPPLDSEDDRVSDVVPYSRAKFSPDHSIDSSVKELSWSYEKEVLKSWEQGNCLAGGMEWRKDGS